MLKETKPTPETIEAGKAAEAESVAKKTKLYGDGVLISCLRSGGLLILEYDAVTHKAIAFHLVSRGENGRDLVLSEEIEGQISQQEAAQAVQMTESLLRDLMYLRIGELPSLFDRRNLGNVPLSMDLGDGFYFLPGIEAIASPEQERQLRILALSMLLRFGRSALSQKAWAASPYDALGRAETELSKAIEGLEDIERARGGLVQDFEAVKDAQELSARIAFLTRLDNYVEQALSAREDRATSESNLTIAALPMQIIVKETGQLAVLTASGFIAHWRRLPNGSLALEGLSIAGD